MSRTQLFGISPNEIAVQTFDFTSRLLAAETVSSATVTAAVYSGATGASALQLYGAASISGKQVTQRVGGGTAGTVYLLTCKVVTSAAQTLELSGYVHVLTSGA